MQTVLLETKIAAPPERCFLLSLSIDLHVQTAVRTDERAIAGVTHGLIRLGETVTWEGRHFGLKLRHKTRITQYDRPQYFQDVMVEGAFRSFVHDHWFYPSAEGGTLTRDELRFSAPHGVLGTLAERLVLRSHLRRFLTERNLAIQTIAEAAPDVWEPFLVQR